MKIEDFIEISGFKEKLSNKIYNNIQERLKNVSLIELMSSSNIFGRGISIKKIELIMEEYPNILFEEESQEKKKEKILKIKGFSTKTTDLFVNYIPDFLDFLKKINIFAPRCSAHSANARVSSTLTLWYSSSRAR